jgi:hypothetical protein
MRRYSGLLAVVAASLWWVSVAKGDWLISTYKAPENQIVTTLAAADAVVANPANRVGSGLYSTFNSADQSPLGFYPNDDKPPGFFAANNDHFAVTGSGFLKVVTEGDYKFASLTDDGAQLRIDGAGVIVDDTLHTAFYPQDVKYSPLVHLTAGFHPIDFLYFESIGVAGGELFLVNPGDNTPIALVGDTAHGGLQVTQTSVPEAGILWLLATAAPLLSRTIHRRRRRPGWGC